MSTHNTHAVTASFAVVAAFLVVTSTVAPVAAAPNAGVTFAAEPAALDATIPAGTLESTGSATGDPPTRAARRHAVTDGAVRAVQATAPGATAGTTGYEPYFFYFSGVNAANGNLYRAEEDVSIGGLGGDLRIVRAYNSHASAEHGPFGFGWTHNYNLRIDERPDGTAVLLDADGSVHTFTPRGGGAYASPPGVHHRLDTVADGWTLRRTDGTTYAFDADGRLTGLTDANDNRVRLAYAGDRLVEIADDAGTALTLGHDAAGRITTVTDPIGRTTTYAYDTGDLVAVTDAANRTTTYRYYDNHKLREAVEPSGRVRTVAYDAGTDRVRCVGSGRAASGCSEAGYVVSYDDGNGMTTFRNLLSGGVTTVEVSDRGTPLRVAGPVETATFGWDADLNRISTTNDTGTFSYAYDAYGNRIRAVDGVGDVREWRWETDDGPDSYQSRLVAHTDPTGATTSYGHDAAGNVVSVTNALGDTRRLSYDANGSLVAETGFGGAETRYAYDARGVRTATIGPDGATTNFSYDAVGRLTARTDPRGGTHRFSYDAADNLVRMVDPLGGVTTAQYDERGVIQSVRRPDGEVRRPDGVPRYPFPPGAAIEEAGNRTTIRTDAYELTRRVDGDGRLVERTIDYGPFSKTATYGYDGADRLVSVRLPDGTRTVAYDLLGRATRVEGPNGTWATFAYDAAGRRTATNYSNGVATTYEYDPVGRPTRVTVADANGTVLADDRYGYDAAGNPTSRTDAAGDLTSYQYDALDRLTSVTYPDGTSTTYAYDGAGDRLSRTADGATTAYTYDTRGRLSRVGVVRYVYDANDSLVTKARTVVDADGRRTERTRYGYGPTGRLENVTRPNGTSVEYAYLPTGERLSRTGPAGTTYYMYAGFELAAEYAPDGSVRAQYVDGPGVDDPVARLGDGATLFYHLDAARNVDRLTDADGAVANRYAYTPYGRLRDRVEAVPQPLRFAARHHDPVAGLYYNRLRYYDPTVGRFTRVDPAGLTAGVNWYAYADGNPLRYTDPMGLDRWEGRGTSAGGTLLVGGFSSFTGTFENADTGQTCSGTMYCAKAGIGLGGSITEAITHFDGPQCGEGLKRSSVDFAVCAGGGAGIGAEGCVNFLSDGGQGGAGIGGFWGASVEAVFLICSVTDLDCSCVEGCGECDDDDERPPGGDHPDDNHDLSVLSYAERYPSAGDGFPDFGYDDGSIAVLGRGFSAELTDFLAERNVTAETVPATVDPATLARYDALVVPSGGLQGLGSLGSFERTLETYVADGGTLVVLSQPRGYHYGSVPGGLGGYGWLEDQSCQLGSVGVTSFCAPLASLSDEVADLNVDGYFTDYPDDATVLLSRTKNGEPAMLSYDYGAGRVLATAAYPDWAFGHHASHADGRAILADVVQWARDDRPIAEYGPGDRAALDLSVTSYVDLVVDETRVDVVAPDGTRSPTNVTGGLAPLATRDVTAGVTLAPDAATGVWAVEYELANDTYGPVQRGRLDRLAVAAFDPAGDGWRFQGENLSLSVTSDTELYAAGANASFDLTVTNRGDAAETVAVYWAFPHNYWETREAIYGAGTTRPGRVDSGLNRTLSVPAGGRESIRYEVPVVSYDRLWAQYYRGSDRTGEFLGTASRGFRTFEPSVAADVATNVTAYAPGDDADVTVSLTAPDPVTVDRTVRVVGPSRFVAVDEATVALPPGEAATETLAVDLPDLADGGVYSVVVEVRRGDDRVGYDATSFLVPATRLNLSLAGPDAVSPAAGDDTLTATVGHVGGFATDATLNATLVGPDGATVWATSRALSVAPSTTASVALAPPFDPGAVGDYRVRATLSWGAERSVTRGVTIRNGATAETAFDRRTYAQGETLGATVTVTNAGRYARDLPVGLAVPDAGVAETRTVSLSPGGNATLPVSVPLPTDIAAGGHDLRVTLGAGTGFERVRTDAFVVPDSSLSASLPTGPVQAGDPLPVVVANDGGVSTTAVCEASVYDATGQRTDRVRVTRTVAAGGTTTVSPGTPAGGATGPYLLSGRCTDDGTGAVTRFARSLTVEGLSASVTVATNRTQYPTGGDVGVGVTAANAGDAIDGTLRVRVRDTAVGGAGGRSTTTTAAAVEDGEAADQDVDADADPTTVAVASGPTTAVDTDDLATGYPGTTTSTRNGTAAVDANVTAATRTRPGNATAPPKPAAIDDSVPSPTEATDPTGSDGGLVATAGGTSGGPTTAAGVSTTAVRVDDGQLQGARTVGDTTVTTARTWRNETVLLDGNLTVGAGGDLTLEDVLLVVNGTRDGEYGIEVLSGGAIALTANTTVLARDSDDRYAFQVRSGAAFRARTATVRDAGWSRFAGADLDERALRIEGATVSVDGLTITDSDEGLHLFDTVDAVLANVSTRSLTVQGARNLTVTGFAYDRSVDARLRFEEVNRSRFLDNDFADPDRFDRVRVTLVESSDNDLRDNRFDADLSLEGFSQYGNDPYGADRNVIANNRFVGDGASVSVDDSNGTVIANNTFEGRGSISVDGFGTVVRDNRLPLDAWRDSSVRVRGLARTDTGTLVANTTASEFTVDAGGVELRGVRGHSAVVNGDRGRIVDSTFAGPSSGVVLKGTNATVTDSTLSDNDRYGLSLQRAVDATLGNLTVRNNLEGDFDMATTNFGTGRATPAASFRHDVTNVTLTGGPLYYLSGAVDATVPTDAGGVWVAGGRNVTVAGIDAGTVGVAYTDNATVRDVTVGDRYYGVVAYYANASRVTNVTATGGRYGVYVEGGRDSVVDGATVTGAAGGSTTAVGLRDTTGVTVRAVTTRDVADGVTMVDAPVNALLDSDLEAGLYGDAVSLIRSDDVVVAGNRLGSPLSVRSTAGSLLRDNRITDARVGIVIDRGDNATVRNNTVVGSGTVGIEFDGTADAVAVDNVVDGYLPATDFVVRRPGIVVRGGDGVRVRGGTVRNVSVGVSVERGATDAVVRGVAVRNVTFDGVRVTSSRGDTRNATLADLTVRAADRSGVRLVGAEAATLRNLTITGGGAGEGLSVRPADRDVDPRYWRHDVTDVTVDGRPVVYWRNRTGGSVPAGSGPVWVVDSTGVTVANGTRATVVATSDATVAGLTTEGGYAPIDLRYVNRTDVENVTAANASVGVSVRVAANVTIRSTTVRGGGTGLYVRHARDVTAEAVSVADSNRGIHLWAVTDGRLEAVTATGVQRDGVVLTTARRVHLADAQLVDNGGAGFLVNGSREGRSEAVNLTGSTVARNDRGVVMAAVSGGVVANNTVTDNQFVGLALTGDSRYTTVDDDAGGNLLYNNYVDNPDHGAVDAEDASSGNRWNVSQRPGENAVGGPFLGGNFWGSYAGADRDGDGLGDTGLPFDAPDGAGDPRIGVGGDFLPLVPTGTGGGGAVVYETSVPLSVAAGATAVRNVTVPGSALSAGGKFRVETDLRSARNQSVGANATAVYVVDGETLVTVATNRTTVPPGGAVAVSGSVFNRATTTRTIGIAVDADGTEVYAESPSVPAGGRTDYAFTLPIDAATLLTATADGVAVSQAVDVAEPSVDATLSAPAVVGRGPFDATLRVANDGPVPVEVTATVAGTPASLSLSPGENRTVTGTTSLTADGTVTATLSGDVRETLSRPVRFGERGTVTVRPPTVAPPGAVEVPFVVENTGELDVTFDATVTVGPRSATRPVAVAAGEQATGRAVVTLPTGSYTASVATPFGTDLASLRVADPDQVTLAVTAGNASDGVVPVTVDARNVGSTPLNATVRARAVGVGADAATTATREVGLAPGATGTVRFDVQLPAGTPPGRYDLRVAALGGGPDGDGALVTATDTFRVRAPAFTLASTPSAAARALEVDAPATLPFAVENVGGTVGRATLSVALPGIAEETRTVLLDPGNRTTVDVGFVVPDDLASGSYPLEYALTWDADGDGTADDRVAGATTVRVSGYEVTVTGGLDARLYDAGDTARLTVTTTNVGAQPVPLFTRVQYNGYDVRRPFVLNASASTTQTFDVPITFPVGGDRKMFYGVYHESGRSFHIDGAYPHERAGNLTLFTDRDRYAIGETVTLTVDPARTGQVSLSAPSFGRQATFGDRRTFTFQVPPLRSGTYYVHASLDNESVSYPFDVDGYRARVLETSLDRATYAGGDDVTLAVRLAPNRNVTADVTATVVGPDGTELDATTARTDLRADLDGTEVVRTVSLPRGGAGVYTVVYTATAAVGGPTPVSLLAGRQYIDVTADAAAGPTAAFDYEPTDPSVGESVRFDAGGSTAPEGGAVAAYEWDLDADGRTDATGEVIRHRFAAAGPADVTLTVTDGAGRTDAVTRTVSVLQPVSLSLTVDRTTVQRNGVVRFSLTRPDTGAPVEGSLVVDGQRVPIGPDGMATYRFRTAGRVLVTATAPSAAGGTLNAGTVTIDVVTPFESGIPGVAGGSPTDVDDDGRYEDVDGDGRFDFVDVINLVFADWARINADPTGRDAMDFDGSGRIDFVDVIDLVFELQQRP